MRNRPCLRLARPLRAWPAVSTAAALCLLLGTGTGFAQRSSRAPNTRNLIENGTFDDPANPFQGWIVDYAWTKNKYYETNKDHVSVVAKLDGRSRVVFLGKDECKMETVPMPFEQGFRYRCRLDAKKGQYPMRIYFAGYKWLPGIRPHDKPEIWELRNIYRSRAAEPTGDSWVQVSTELPGAALSDTAKSLLKDVRFITLYVYTASPAYVDNVFIEKIPDPSVKFP